MKNSYLFLLLSLCITTLTFPACTLDKEPEALTGITNENAPVFLSTELAAITHDSIRARARLSSLGNLDILHHGWVWSENPKPTLDDSTLELDILEIDSFETLIPDLSLGKSYHMRPYVSTGSGETYGPEQTILMDIPKLSDVTLVADSACFLRVQGSVQSLAPPVEYGIVYLAGSGTPTLQQKSGQVQGAGLNNGNFQTDLTMLMPNTVYSIRAYAKSASGTGYGSVLAVTTPTSILVAANFSINTDGEIFQGAIVQFTNSSIGATTYSWSFGDGETSKVASPLHTFDIRNDNTLVQLTAENGGCILTKDTILKVIENPFTDYWVEVPGGTFLMGCTSDQEPNCSSSTYPIHQVTLDTFFIGKTEVTQGQWLAVTGNNPSYFYQCGFDCPIEYITWERIADEFFPALNRKTGRAHRLPTEAEWEFAARGGNGSMGYKYAGGDDIDSVALWGGNSGSGTQEVRRKNPNELGLYDMSGNVQEWCADRYGPYTSAPTINPTGPSFGGFRVIRGGSWHADVAVYLQVSNRTFYAVPLSLYAYTGFRLVLDK